MNSPGGMRFWVELSCRWQETLFHHGHYGPVCLTPIYLVNNPDVFPCISITITNSWFEFKCHFKFYLHPHICLFVLALITTNNDKYLLKNYSILCATSHPPPLPLKYFIIVLLKFLILEWPCILSCTVCWALKNQPISIIKFWMCKYLHLD